MRARRWDLFKAEIQGVYKACGRAHATCVKLDQVLAEIQQWGKVRSTADLTPLAISQWINGRLLNVSHATRRGLLSYARAVTAYARKAGYLEVDPFEVRSLRDWSGRAPVVLDEWAKALSLVQIRALLAQLEREAAESWTGARLHALVTLVAYTGLRRNEALWLQRGDFDLDLGIVRLVERWRYKTYASAQPVPLADAAIAVIAPWLGQCGSIWAFPGKRGTGPWTGGSPGSKPLDQLRAAGERAGVPGVTFLALRHSWATHAEAWGLGELMVQRVLRHTRKETQRHYRHADTANLRSAVRSIRFEAPDQQPPRPAASNAVA